MHTLAAYRKEDHMNAHLFSYGAVTTQSPRVIWESLGADARSFRQTIPIFCVTEW